MGTLLRVPNGDGKDECEVFNALTQLNVTYEMRYRDPKDMSSAVEKFPVLGRLMNSEMAGPMMMLPKEIKEAMKKLDGLSEGIKHIAMRGLPHKFKIDVVCKNFKISSVLKELIKFSEEQESKSGGS